jgi:DNA/RNA-binding domain of Phe-tRNA-synthetase-like protein
VHIALEEHPSLEARAFITELPRPLGETPSPDWLVASLRLDAQAPFKPEEAVRTTIRDLLRHGGYKPTGRGKPASEYLVRAAGEGTLGSINLAVDACNAASLHSGLPVSVIDLARAREPLRIALAAPNSEYVFNLAGQVIDVEGLLCLHDADGPCANPVKDAQRTKTSDATRVTLSVVWGARGVPGRSEAAAEWYRSLLERAGGRCEAVALG